MNAGFLEIYDKYLELKQPNITEGSFQTLKKLKVKIEKYEVLKKKRIFLADMTLEWFQLFSKAMVNGRIAKCTNGTLRLYMNCINSFLKHCHIFGYKVNQDNIKFREFMKLYKRPKFDRPILLDEELADIWNYKSYKTKSGKEIPLTKYKTYIRDLFIFQCQIGIRWSDISRLKRNDIVLHKGKYYINNFTTKKTKSNIFVQLNELAMKVIRMYCKRFDKMSPKNCIFKNVENCSNATHTLKWIAQKVNLDRVVEIQKGKLDKVKIFKKKIYQIISTHKARAKFATDWIINGKSIYKLKIILGHASVKTTERYIRTLPGWIPDGVETELNQQTKLLFNL